MTARIFNVLVGAWLIATGVAWQHGGALATTTFLCGAVTAAVGIASVANSRWLVGNWLRLAGVVAAGVLVVATLALSNRHQPTFWNNIIAAIAVIVSTLLMGSGGRASVRDERERYGHL